MSEEQQGPSAAMQQFQLNSQIAAGQGGGGGDTAVGGALDALIRKIFRLNAHSTGGLASLFGDLGSVFSGTSLQGKSIFSSMLDARGGVLANIGSSLGFTFGGSIHQGTGAQVQDAPVDTSGGGGGGDAQYASLQNMPSAAMTGMEAAITNIQNHQAAAADHTPPPRGANAARRGARAEGGESMSR